MSTPAASNNTFEIGLNIHLLSFSLPKDLIKDREEVRISITTFPELTKQHFYIQGKKMNCSNHVFTINITNLTKNIVMVFRKKAFLSDNPIIASKTIHLREFGNLPKEPITTGIINSDVKTMNIHYPLRDQETQKPNHDNKRKILGSMQIQLSFTSPYMNANNEKKEKSNASSNKKNNLETKAHKFGKKSTKNEYQKIDNQNEFVNYSMF